MCESKLLQAISAVRMSVDNRESQHLHHTHVYIFPSATVHFVQLLHSHDFARRDCIVISIDRRCQLAE